MAKYIDNLGATMKDRETFDTLPAEIKGFVYGFLHANRKIRGIQKKLLIEKEKYEAIITPLKKELKKQKELESLNYNNIKELPSKLYSIARLYVERDKNSYMVVLTWCNKKRKFSIGGDLRDIEKRLKGLNKDFNSKLTTSNYKVKITEGMKFHLNDFLLKNGVQKYLEETQILWDSKGRFSYQKITTKGNKDITEGKLKAKRGKASLINLKVRSKGYRVDF
jgi:hypothetical protein